MAQTTKIFDEDLERAYQGIRGAMTELLGSVNADPSRPQDLAREFKINKNLAWKISKLIMVSDPHQMVPNIPGKSGMNTVLRAFESKGAPTTALSATRGAFDEFDEMVRVHVGDRSTLQLALTSSNPGGVSQEHAHATRKMAYQGNSAIWGVQARVRFGSFFIAPNSEDDSLIDTASVGGLLDVRRLRKNIGISLFSRFAYNDDGSLRDNPQPKPIVDGDDSTSELMLMPQFCTNDRPSFQTRRADGVTRFTLLPGPVGNIGKQSWVFGEYDRGFASKFQDENNMVGEHAVPISVPTEWFLCDLQVHRELSFAFTPRVYAESIFNPQPAHVADHDSHAHPIAETVHSIGSEPPVVATPHIGNYPEIVGCVYDRLGWSASDFHGFRFLMKYPPLHSCLIMQHGLLMRQ